jgi:hypothetical protein
MIDPRVLLAEIPNRLEKDDKGISIPYPTVQRRVQQMTNERVLNRGYIIDWARAGYIFRYRVEIKIDQTVLKDFVKNGANSIEERKNSIEKRRGLLREKKDSYQGDWNSIEENLESLQEEIDLIEEEREFIYEQFMRIPNKGRNEYDLQIRLAQYIRTILPKQERFKDKLVVNDVFVMLGGDADLEGLVYSRNNKVAMEFIVNGLRNLPGIVHTSSAKFGFSSRYGWLGENHNGEGGYRASKNSS